ERHLKTSGWMLNSKHHRQGVVPYNSMSQRTRGYRRRRHRDRTGNRKRGVTGMRHEIAGADCATLSRRRDQHRLWNDAIRRIRNAHQFARLYPKHFETAHELAIGTEFSRRLVTRLSEIRCTDKDDRHSRVDAGYLDAVHPIERTAGRQQFTRL